MSVSSRAPATLTAAGMSFFSLMCHPMGSLTRGLPMVWVLDENSSTITPRTLDPEEGEEAARSTSASCRPSEPERPIRFELAGYHPCPSGVPKANCG